MRCVIFGAGKIARGFIGHLLTVSEIPFTFVEKSEALVALIRQRRQYTVNVLGNREKNCTVKDVSVLGFDEKEKITQAISQADAVFTAVGGKNLEGVVPYLSDGITAKSAAGGTLNIVTCENWKQPADVLRKGIESRLSGAAREYFEKNVGVTEAVIMRSAIEPDAAQLALDPLTVNVQDFWKLPVDASRLRGALPDIVGLQLIDEFAGFLERKFYTYNAANGTVSYLGALLGYEKIADAAHDTWILTILGGVYQETGRALSIKHHYPLEEQLAFTKTSKEKLQNRVIVDSIERNARDPMRKLGPDDRLVGSARMALACGVAPKNLCIAIAAAMHYTNDADESAKALRTLREEEGVDAVLKKVCRVEPDGELGSMVKEGIEFLKREGKLP